MKKSTILAASAIGIGVGIGLILVLSCTGLLYLYVQFAADPIPTLVVVNNSGQGLTVTSAAPPISIAVSTITEVSITATTPLWVLTTADGRTWKYKWAPVDGITYGYTRIYVQIEANGAIYVLPGKVKAASKPLPAQPAGYPLQPQ